jgi:hypothetical protein
MELLHRERVTPIEPKPVTVSDYAHDGMALRNELDVIVKCVADVKSAYMKLRVSYGDTDIKNALRVLEDTRQIVIQKSVVFLEKVRKLRTADPHNELYKYLFEKFRTVNSEFNSMEDSNLQNCKDSKEAITEVQMQMISERHQEIIKLEESINEMHELFLDVAVLVDGQGERVKDITVNVEVAETHAAKSNIVLKQAHEYKKKSVGKRICIAVWTILIVGGIATLAGFFGLRR